MFVVEADVCKYTKMIPGMMWGCLIVEIRSEVYDPSESITNPQENQQAKRMFYCDIIPPFSSPRTGHFEPHHRIKHQPSWITHLFAPATSKKQLNRAPPKKKTALKNKFSPKLDQLESPKIQTSYSQIQV